MTTISSIASVGIQGLNTGLESVTKAAQDISALAVQSESGDATASLVDAVADLKGGQQVFDASAQVVKAADEVIGTILDVSA